MSRGNGVQVADASTEHEVGLLTVEIVDGADMRAVHYPKGKIMEEVAISMYVEFLGKDIGLLWSHAVKK